MKPQIIALAPGSQIGISRLVRYMRVDLPFGVRLPPRHLLELVEMVFEH